MTNENIIIDNMFVTIRKGSIISTPNPEWDGDKPETEFYIESEVLEDFNVFIGNGSGSHPIETKILGEKK